MFLAAAVYASVGHGGASAYLAILGLAGLAPEHMKPIALVLNTAVSLLAMLAFRRAGHFRADLFWPLAIASIPAAFLGGWMQATNPVFRTILALALTAGAARLVLPSTNQPSPARRLHPAGAMALGGGLGFLSGLVGIGGGVFLTPVLILARWSTARAAAAISAAFIFVNSLAGLAGWTLRGGRIPMETWYWLPAVAIGGMAGSAWGSRHARPVVLCRVLAVVLLAAAIKFATA